MPLYLNPKTLPEEEKSEEEFIISEAKFDLTSIQKEENDQPEFHEQNKTICMKVFPKLAERTNLTPDELKMYFFIRFEYV